MEEILQSYTCRDLRKIVNKYNTELKTEIIQSKFSRDVKEKIHELRFIELKQKSKDEIISRMMKLEQFFDYLSSFSCCNNNVTSDIPDTDIEA